MFRKIYNWLFSPYSFTEDRKTAVLVESKGDSQTIYFGGHSWVVAVCKLDSERRQKISVYTHGDYRLPVTARRQYQAAAQACLNVLPAGVTDTFAIDFSGDQPEIQECID